MCSQLKKYKRLIIVSIIVFVIIIGVIYLLNLPPKNKEEKINVIVFRNVLNSWSMLLEQPDYKKQRKIHSEEGKDDEQTD